MRIDTPTINPPASGDYRVRVSKGYGIPRGSIILSETSHLELEDIRIEDCDRLIRAIAEIKTGILAYREKSLLPHGRDHFYQGECQLCGKPEDDELHAEAERCDAERVPGKRCSVAPAVHIVHEDGTKAHMDADGIHWADAPVITDSERTCDQANPDTGAWCHRDGDHGVHRDTDGEEWRTDLAEAAAGQ